jgi:hypothetical protein
MVKTKIVAVAGIGEENFRKLHGKPNTESYKKETDRLESGMSDKFDEWGKQGYDYFIIFTGEEQKGDAIPEKVAKRKGLKYKVIREPSIADVRFGLDQGRFSLDDVPFIKTTHGFARKVTPDMQENIDRIKASEWFSITTPENKKDILNMEKDVKAGKKYIDPMNVSVGGDRQYRNNVVIIRAEDEAKKLDVPVDYLEIHSIPYNERDQRSGSNATRRKHQQHDKHNKKKTIYNYIGFLEESKSTESKSNQTTKSNKIFVKDNPLISEIYGSSERKKIEDIYGNILGTPKEGYKLSRGRTGKRIGYTPTPPVQRGGEDIKTFQSLGLKGYESRLLGSNRKWLSPTYESIYGKFVPQKIEDGWHYPKEDLLSSLKRKPISSKLADYPETIVLGSREEFKKGGLREGEKFIFKESDLQSEWSYDPLLQKMGFKTLPPLKDRAIISQRLVFVSDKTGKEVNPDTYKGKMHQEYRKFSDPTEKELKKLDKELKKRFAPKLAHKKQLEKRLKVEKKKDELGKWKTISGKKEGFDIPKSKHPEDIHFGIVSNLTLEFSEQAAEKLSTLLHDDYAQWKSEHSGPKLQQKDSSFVDPLGFLPIDVSTSSDTRYHEKHLEDISKKKTGSRINIDSLNFTKEDLSTLYLAEKFDKTPEPIDYSKNYETIIYERTKKGELKPTRDSEHVPKPKGVKKSDFDMEVLKNLRKISEDEYILLKPDKKVLKDLTDTYGRDEALKMIGRHYDLHGIDDKNNMEKGEMKYFRNWKNELDNEDDKIVRGGKAHTLVEGRLQLIDGKPEIIKQEGLIKTQPANLVDYVEDAFHSLWADEDLHNLKVVRESDDPKTGEKIRESITFGEVMNKPYTDVKTKEIQDAMYFALVNKYADDIPLTEENQEPGFAVNPDTGLSYVNEKGSQIWLGINEVLDKTNPKGKREALPDEIGGVVPFKLKMATPGAKLATKHWNYNVGKESNLGFVTKFIGPDGKSYENVHITKQDPNNLFNESNDEIPAVMSYQTKLPLFELKSGEEKSQLVKDQAPDKNYTTDSTDSKGEPNKPLLINNKPISKNFYTQMELSQTYTGDPDKDMKTFQFETKEEWLEWLEDNPINTAKYEKGLRDLQDKKDQLRVEFVKDEQGNSTGITKYEEKFYKKDELGRMVPDVEKIKAWEDLEKQKIEDNSKWQSGDKIVSVSTDKIAPRISTNLAIIADTYDYGSPEAIEKMEEDMQQRYNDRLELEQALSVEYDTVSGGPASETEQSEAYGRADLGFGGKPGTSDPRLLEGVSGRVKGIEESEKAQITEWNQKFESGGGLPKVLEKTEIRLKIGDDTYTQDAQKEEYLHIYGERGEGHMLGKPGKGMEIKGRNKYNPFYAKIASADPKWDWKENNESYAELSKRQKTALKNVLHNRSSLSDRRPTINPIDETIVAKIKAIPSNNKEEGTNNYEPKYGFLFPDVYAVTPEGKLAPPSEERYAAMSKNILVKNIAYQRLAKEYAMSPPELIEFKNTPWTKQNPEHRDKFKELKADTRKNFAEYVYHGTDAQITDKDNFLEQMNQWGGSFSESTDSETSKEDKEVFKSFERLPPTNGTPQTNETQQTNDLKLWEAFIPTNYPQIDVKKNLQDTSQDTSQTITPVLPSVVETKVLEAKQEADEEKAKALEANREYFNKLMNIQEQKLSDSESLNKTLGIIIKTNSQEIKTNQQLIDEFKAKQDKSVDTRPVFHQSTTPLTNPVLSNEVTKVLEPLPTFQKAIITKEIADEIAENDSTVRFYADKRTNVNGHFFKFEGTKAKIKKIGTQNIQEIDLKDLKKYADGTYEFVIAKHPQEAVTNIEQNFVNSQTTQPQPKITSSSPSREYNTRIEYDEAIKEVEQKMSSLTSKSEPTTNATMRHLIQLQDTKERLQKERDTLIPPSPDLEGQPTPFNTYNDDKKGMDDSIFTNISGRPTIKIGNTIIDATPMKDESRKDYEERMKSEARKGAAAQKSADKLQKDLENIASGSTKFGRVKQGVSGVPGLIAGIGADKRAHELEMAKLGYAPQHGRRRNTVMEAMRMMQQMTPKSSDFGVQGKQISGLFERDTQQMMGRGHSALTDMGTLISKTQGSPLTDFKTQMMSGGTGTLGGNLAANIGGGPGGGTRGIFTSGKEFLEDRGRDTSLRLIQGKERDTLSFSLGGTLGLGTSMRPEHGLGSPSGFLTGELVPKRQTQNRAPNGRENGARFQGSNGQ